MKIIFIIILSFITNLSASLTNINIKKLEVDNIICNNSNIDCSGNGICQIEECICFPGYISLPNMDAKCSYQEKSQTISFCLTLIFLGLFGAGRFYLCNWDWVAIQLSLFSSLILMACISCCGSCCYILYNKDNDEEKIENCIDNTSNFVKLFNLLIIIAWVLIWIIDTFKAGYNMIPDMCTPMINGSYIYPRPW